MKRIVEYNLLLKKIDSLHNYSTLLAESYIITLQKSILECDGDDAKIYTLIEETNNEVEGLIIRLNAQQPNA